MASAYDQPALGGVYKLGAVRPPGQAWQPRIKLSDQAAKASIPGLHQVRRFRDAQGFCADVIFDAALPPAGDSAIVDLMDPDRHTATPQSASHQDLLIPIFEGGRRVYQPPDLQQVRARLAEQLARLDAGVKRLTSPRVYPVGLEQSLHQLRTHLMHEARRR